MSASHMLWNGGMAVAFRFRLNGISRTIASGDTADLTNTFQLNNSTIKMKVRNWLYFRHCRHSCSATRWWPISCPSSERDKDIIDEL